MKDQSTSFLKVMLAYCLVIGLVLIWSGHDKEKTIFNKYLTSFKGITIGCTNPDLSSQFFKEVLELSPNKTKNDQFILPDNTQITLTNSKNPSSDEITIRLRVRNGIYHLYDRLEKRIVKFQETHNSSKISEIRKTKNNILFNIQDPSGTNIIFYQERIFGSKNP